MKIDRILCPIDHSEFNQVANEYASTLAEATGARIVYLHVSTPDVPYGAHAYFDPETEEQQELQRLREFKPTKPNVEASYVIEFGSPIDRIVEYANENKIDLIVMATHGRTGILRVVMGSVAEAIIRKAECPVLALKAGTRVLQSN